MKTKQQWQALSESLILKGQAYIDGQFQDAINAEIFHCINQLGCLIPQTIYFFSIFKRSITF